MTMFEMQPTPPTEMLAMVVSATQRRIVVVLPDWNPRLAVCISQDDPQWPSLRNLLPAVHMRYICQVELDGDEPRIVAWSDPVQDSGGPHLPHPLPAPNDLPGPPDLLPVHNDGALHRLLDKHLGSMKKSHRESVVYLIRRAYGQGLSERKRPA